MSENPKSDKSTDKKGGPPFRGGAPLSERPSGRPLEARTNKLDVSPPPSRARLPNRRPSHFETLEVGGQTITACIGFDPATGQPREVFLNGGTAGSQVDALVADAATIISVALQFGVPIAALAKSVGRVPNVPATPGALDRLVSGGQPASLIGAALDLLIAHDPRPNGEPSSE